MICTHDRHDLLPAAIDSLKQQSLPARDFEILIVDNSSDPEAAAASASKYSGIGNLRYITESSPGLSNARNVAARNCETEYLAYMDDDAIADENWLHQLLCAWGQFETEAGVVGGRVDPIWGSPRPAWLHDHLLGYVSVVNWGGLCRQAAPNEWFAGTNVSYRTESILRLGGFSTALGRHGKDASLLGNEELALSEKIRSTGKILVYAPLARVNHLVAAGRLNTTWFRKRVVWQAISDFTWRPELAVREAAEHWPEFLKYFSQLAPRERTIRGLYSEPAEPDGLLKQLRAIRLFTLSSLAGFEHCDK